MEYQNNNKGDAPVSKRLSRRWPSCVRSKQLGQVERPATWQFTPAPTGQLPERLASVIRYAEAKCLAIGSVTVTVEPRPDEVPAEVRIRKLLKHAGRDCGLKARWPMPDAAGLTEGDDADVRSVQTPDAPECTASPQEERAKVLPSHPPVQCGWPRRLRRDPCF